MNRYGRHGTGAWLRRHLRQRQQRISTALVTAKPFIPVVVFNITVPAGVGKVVIIVNDEQGQPLHRTEIDGQGVIQSGGVQPSSRFKIVESEQEEDDNATQKIKRLAFHGAYDFLEDIIFRYNDAAIYITAQDFDTYTQNLSTTNRRNAPSEVKGSEKGMPGVFDQIFLEEFRRLLRHQEDLLKESKLAHSVEFLDLSQWEICDIAQKDRQKVLPDYTRVGQDHERDLAAMSAVKYFKIDHETATNWDQLKKVHDFADTYEKYYRGERKGEMWVGAPGIFLR